MIIMLLLPQLKETETKPEREAVIFIDGGQMNIISSPGITVFSDVILILFSRQEIAKRINQLAIVALQLC
jgi:hypothetical protein